MKVISIIYIILLAVALTGCSASYGQITETTAASTSTVSSLETDPPQQVKSSEIATDCNFDCNSEAISQTTQIRSEIQNEEIKSSTEEVKSLTEFEFLELLEIEPTEETVDLFNEVQFMTIPPDEPETQEPALPDAMDERGYLQFVSQREIEMLACLVDWEIGAGTRIEKEAVVWCVLNRLDKGSAAGFKNTVSGVLLQENQFYSSYVVGSIESQNLVVDVLTLWMIEHQSGYPIDGRCLPREYCWYCSDDNRWHNLFHDQYIVGIGQCGNTWDWSWTGGF